MDGLGDLLWRVLERDVVPDAVVRAAIRSICAERLRESRAGGIEAQEARKMAFVRARRDGPIARVPDAANRQHYEVPPEFFTAVLGPRRKYSCAYWPDGVATLAAAEEAMLELTCRRAQITDGQTILDLGCGWGALSLWLCERYPRARVTGLSNSRPQREHILGEARRRGLSNLEILTGDVSTAALPGGFDRVVSVEMIEHTWNTEALLDKIAAALVPDGKLFVHIFTHRAFAYPFEDRGAGDWMARTFFTGGSMLSDDYLLYCNRTLVVDDQWRFDGTHYARTAEAWLANLDRARAELAPIFERTYGAGQAARWHLNWRLFFLACAEMFGYGRGQEWGVTHYLMGRPAR